MKSKKLGLNKATIANLNNIEMRLVYGGDPAPSAPNFCKRTIECQDPTFIATDPPAC